MISQSPNPTSGQMQRQSHRKRQRQRQRQSHRKRHRQRHRQRQRLRQRWSVEFILIEDKNKFDFKVFHSIVTYYCYIVFDV
jgi:hypothetical protein